MKSIKCYLICYGRLGYPTIRGFFPSINKALQAKDEDPYGFTYIIMNEQRTKILKKGFCK